MPGPVEALRDLVRDSIDFFSTMGTGLIWFLRTILDFTGAPLLKSSKLPDTNLHLAPFRAVQYFEVFRNFCFSLSLYLRSTMDDLNLTVGTCKSLCSQLTRGSVSWGLQVLCPLLLNHTCVPSPNLSAACAVTNDNHQRVGGAGVRTVWSIHFHVEWKSKKATL